MADIGHWGKELSFYVNSKKQMPFRNLKREVGSRWASHNIVQQNPRTEYQGMEQTKITLEVTFSAYHGQRPYKSVSRLNTACKKGYINYLYIGGHRLGGKKYYIKSVSTTWDEVWSKGELVRASCDITFEEYN